MAHRSLKMDDDGGLSMMNVAMVVATKMMMNAMVMNAMNAMHAMNVRNQMTS